MRTKDKSSPARRHAGSRNAVRKAASRRPAVRKAGEPVRLKTSKKNSRYSIKRMLEVHVSGYALHKAEGKKHETFPLNSKNFSSFFVAEGTTLDELQVILRKAGVSFEKEGVQLEQRLVIGRRRMTRNFDRHINAQLKKLKALKKNFEKKSKKLVRSNHGSRKEYQRKLRQIDGE